MEEFDAILMPVSGPPTEIKIKMEDVNKLFNCKYTDHMSFPYLDWFGYRLAILVDDSGVSKELPINPLATYFAKDRGYVCGPAILVDDEKKLTMDEFRKIMEIVKIIPFADWRPCETKIDENLDPIWVKYITSGNEKYKQKVRKAGINEKEILKKLWKYIPDEIKNEQLKGITVT